MRSTFGHLALVAVASCWLTACGGTSSPPAKPPVATTPFFIANTCNYLTTTLSGTEQICFYGLPNVIAGVPFSLGLITDAGAPNLTIPIQATDVKPPISFQLLPGSSMPPGLTFNTNGLVSGTPTQPGTYAFSVVAVDSSTPTPRISDQARFTLHVVPPGALLREVGHSDLGGGGQNADVTVHGAYAFVGTRGVPGACPSTGVKIVSLSDPTNPQLLLALPSSSGGAYEPEVKVATVSSPSFQGDLMAVAVAPCDPATDGNANDRGVALYDVSNPATPKFLSFWPSGVQGVSDVAILPRPDSGNPANSKVYLLAAVPNSELTDPNQQGDLRVLDVTDPLTPVQIGQWGIFKALNIDPNSVHVGQDQRVFLDTITLSSDGTKAFLAYWDEGVVVMDVSNPPAIADSAPNLALSHITYPTIIAATPDHFSAPEGNTHQALAIGGDTGLIISDKVCASQKIPDPNNPGATISANPATKVVCGTDVDLTPSAGWGYLRTYSLPSFATPSAQGSVVLSTGESDPPPDNGIYTPNNLAWNGNTQDPHAYIAWFSNGVVDVDLSSLSAPAVLGAFVPPASPDPRGANPTVNNPDVPLVYGVAAYAQGANQYIVLSDINSGLWVVQETSAPQFAILTTSLPDGTTQVPYNAQLITANGTAPVSWTMVSGSGAMPPGLTLNPNGTITGTPQVNSSGTYSFTVRATNSNGNGEVATQAYTVVINSNITITTTALPVATLNETYTYTLKAVNGSGALAWNLQGGSLPPSVALNSATGQITGTPPSSGTFTFTVGVSDSSNPPQTTTQSLSLQVAPFAFSAPSRLSDGGVGQNYFGGLSLLNGTGPFTFVVTSGSLPPGIAMTPATGTFSGAPTTAGTYTFTVQVTDADGQTASRQFTIVVQPFAVATTSLPNGTVNQGYFAPIQLSNGAVPFVFTISAGSLPPGLTVSALYPNGTPGATSGTAGAISGVPTTPGSYSFTVQATDKNGNLATATYTLTISP